MTCAVRGQPHPTGQLEYYQASLETRMSYGLFYLGLAIFLLLMSHGVHQQLDGLRAVAV